MTQSKLLKTSNKGRSGPNLTTVFRLLYPGGQRQEELRAVDGRHQGIPQGPNDGGLHQGRQVVGSFLGILLLLSLL